MRNNSENNIQVLGTKRTKRRWWLWGVVGVLPVLVIGLVAVAFLPRETEEKTAEKVEIQWSRSFVPPKSMKRGSMSVSIDSMNNVSFRIFNLQHVHPSLEREYPQAGDSTLLLAVPAADFRKDNGEIVGDFVYRGERLARGQRKTGYLAILDGRMVIGNSETDEMRDYCEAHQGDFFRQYILVFEGQMQENRLKGKSFRRAIVQRGEEWVVVESLNRESLYDFSEALADYGYTSALYLVGAPSPMVWREDGEWQGSPSLDFSLCRHPNYLVFRR